MNYKRILKEIQELEKDLKYNENSIIQKIIADNKNINKMSIIIKGPKDSPYENGLFLLIIELTDNYPFSPPHIKFGSKILHPNISKDGKICVDIFGNKWSAALTISKVLLSLSSLLVDPNPDSPLNSDIAEIYKDNRIQYNEKVKKHTKENTYKY